jgi:exopolyphosphatase/guanosine-5'-triphosphate,3'-diphosphate pyrophosphatase
VVATAAVRGAEDGQEFVARIARETGFDVRVLSGAEEARLSAQGVLASAPDADGVVGDLGGSSLELVQVSGGRIAVGETHALGPLALMDAQPFNAERVQKLVDEALRASAVLQQGHSKVLYAVGGAWRALGREEIKLNKRPLDVLNHHEMTRKDLADLIPLLIRQSRKSLERSGEEAIAKRADVLPYAAVLMDRLLAIGGFERVFLSAYGLREGVLFERVAPNLRALHPLVAAAEAFGGPGERARAFGRALEAWLTPVFQAAPPAFTAERDRVLRAAACRLADLGGHLHPDQRQGVIFDLVLSVHFAAITHAERAFLATVLHHRYSRAFPQSEREPAYRLLTEEQRTLAAALGAGLRMGADLSGRAPALLQAFALSLSDGRLVITGKIEDAHLLTETVLKRIEPLADALGVSWAKALS